MLWLTEKTAPSGITAGLAAAVAGVLLAAASSVFADYFHQSGEVDGWRTACHRAKTARGCSLPVIGSTVMDGTLGSINLRITIHASSKAEKAAATKPGASLAALIASCSALQAACTPESISVQSIGDDGGHPSPCGAWKFEGSCVACVLGFG